MVRKLLFLGQLSPVIRALDRESKIDTVQALLLTSMLFSLDLSRCKLVLFCPEGNKGLFV